MAPMRKVPSDATRKNGCAVAIERSIRYQITRPQRERSGPVAISSKDVMPLSQAKDHLVELAEEVRTGREKILTQNGEDFVALVDARRLERYHLLEREHAHLTLLDEAERALDDMEAGRTISVEEFRAKYGR